MVLIYLRARSTNVGFGFGEVLDTRAFPCDMPSGVLCSTRSFKYRNIQTMRQQVNVLFFISVAIFRMVNVSTSLVLHTLKNLA